MARRIVEKGVRQVSDYAVYIDEAGDLGIGRGTRWFVLTAVVVKKTVEPQIRARMTAIKACLNVREIHLRKITEFYKRAFIVRELRDEEFVYMNVLVDTDKFDRARIPNPIIAYNYVCKYLLQRVSWYLSSLGSSGDIVLSARGTSRDGELIQYIQEKLLPYPSNGIDASSFGAVTAKTAAAWDMLQLADVCATSMFLTYEVNRYGFSTPCFSVSMSDHIYRNNNGKIDSYGIKFFTSDMKPNVTALKKSRICTKKERTPGTTTT